ncbi:MAG TPA: hypothetical protein VIM71_08535 [Lacunisphaera sp.]
MQRDRLPYAIREPGQADDPAEKPRASAKDEFAQMDTDHDGRVSAAEYSASPRSSLDRIAEGKQDGTGGPTGGLGLRDSEGRPDRSTFFRRLDTNRDGYLSRRELGMPGR